MHHNEHYRLMVTVLRTVNNTTGFLVMTQNNHRKIDRRFHKGRRITGNAMEARFEEMSEKKYSWWQRSTHGESCNTVSSEGNGAQGFPLKLTDFYLWAILNNNLC